jgi:LysR family transcriptional regulator of abg operon
MTLIQLRAFCAIVNYGGFRAAARALDITQSAVTQAVKMLEMEFSVTLLNRSNVGISLTPSGHDLLARASAVLADCDRITQHLRQYETEMHGTIAVGVTAEPLVQLMMPVLERFNARYPSVTVKLASGSSDTLIKRIREGQLDFALCLCEPSVSDADLFIERLYSSTPGIIARRNHPKANVTTVRELADCVWVGQSRLHLRDKGANRLEQLFAANRLGKPRVAVIAESMMECLQVVAETDFLAIEPAMLTDLKLFSSALVTIPIAEPITPRDVCFVRRAELPPTPPAQELSLMLMSYSRLTPNAPITSTVTDSQAAFRLRVVGASPP